MQAIASVLIVGLNAILTVFFHSGGGAGVYYKLQSFVFMPVFGLNNGLMPIMGYNFGAKTANDFDATKIGLVIAVAIMAVGTLVFMIFPPDSSHVL